MPKKSEPKPLASGTAPLRLPFTKPAPKRPDPRLIGTGIGRGRPTGGRPPRFPGRTGGR